MNKILDATRRHSSSYAKEKILLAVSGGVDSVVLCDLFHRTEIKFGMAHCNYGLRGVESDMDEALVRTLARDYNVDCFVKHFDTSYLKKSQESIQMLARELRYSWFKELCLQHGFTKIATAHHADDCMETALLNLSRGTSLRGVCNMLLNNSLMIRPLLKHTKQEINDYAIESGLEWREDASNRGGGYKRNIIRNSVLPKLKSLNPRLERTFISSLDRLAQTQYLWEDYMETLKRGIVQSVGDTLVLDITKIQNAKWAVLALYELLSSYHFTYHQISDFVKNRHNPGSKLLSKTHTIYTDRGRWLVVPKGHSLEILSKSQILIGENSFSEGALHLMFSTVEAANYEMDKRRSVASLDKSLLKFPLAIRKWRSGDYFYPLGMKRRKKISDFLIDEKISSLEKEMVYLILSGEEIVWVVDHRIDDRYKVTSATSCIYEIKIAPGENT